ncbi:hypothetical protein NHX12_001071 [Muraenolepis orangiensis]|uniref:Apoptosis-associated speck-like protein containing a CARD n=1 Tax=Muraenolepis orangiensis TaxID=630683 RepID=A0A9Q0E075_9TELE|nr:hypothetical protein NHX12_001071 [Muraenolepis orangiensis]
MASTVKHVLLNTLEDLTKKQLSKFCARLLDREREPRVRRSALENVEEIMVVDVLVSTFTEAGAGTVAVETLRLIDCNDLAGTLETSLAALPARRKSRKSTGSTIKLGPEAHFVDRHHSSLVQRIGNVPPILDQLLSQKVVSQEQYAIILAKATPQEQVRQLYVGALMSSGDRGKDIFLGVLEKTEPFLIDDLKLRGQ